MANIQKTLDALQPYVIGIRYLEGMPVVDVVFKEGWTLPDSSIINKTKGNEDMNYYMLYSDKESIGLDELLEYVETTIKANIEKEKKHELLKEKVNELKELFKKTSLTKLQKLKFSFLDEDLVPSINEFDIDQNLKNEESKEPEITQEPEQIINQEIPLTEEEREILEEEKRAEAYRKLQESKKKSQNLENIKNKVELPPKKNFENSNSLVDNTCECGPDEACSICIDKKSL